MTILELLDRLSWDDVADTGDPERMRAALRRIATDFAPGPEPLHDPRCPHDLIRAHIYRNRADWRAAHARWQALTEVQAAILEELQS